MKISCWIIINECSVTSTFLPHIRTRTKWQEGVIFTTCIIFFGSFWHCLKKNKCNVFFNYNEQWNYHIHSLSTSKDIFMNYSYWGECLNSVTLPQEDSPEPSGKALTKVGNILMSARTCDLLHSPLFISSCRRCITLL